MKLKNILLTNQKKELVLYLLFMPKLKNILLIWREQERKNKKCIRKRKRGN